MAEGRILDSRDLMRVKLNSGQLIMFLNDSARCGRCRQTASWNRSSASRSISRNLFETRSPTTTAKRLGTPTGATYVWRRRSEITASKREE